MKEELFSATPADGETLQAVQQFQLSGSSELPSRFQEFGEGLFQRIRGMDVSEDLPSSSAPVKFPSTAQPEPLKGLGKRKG